MFMIAMITADLMLRKGSWTVPRVAILSSYICKITYCHISVGSHWLFYDSLNSHNDQSSYDAKDDDERDYDDDDAKVDDDNDEW